MKCERCGHPVVHPSTTFRRRRKAKGLCAACGKELEGDDQAFARCADCRATAKSQQYLRRH